MRSKGEATRQDIVDAAKTLFYRRGYFHTSFSDIVAKAAVRRGNIYHYFKTKDDILGAVIDRHLDDYRRVMAAWEDAHLDPRDRLMCFIEMVADNRNNLARYGCPIGTLNTELGRCGPDLRRAARALFDLFRDWLSAQFRSLGHGRKDAEALALHLLVRAEGVSLMTHVYADTALLSREIVDLRNWLDGAASGRKARGRPAKRTSRPA